jgi:hypothetical protein
MGGGTAVVGRETRCAVRLSEFSVSISLPGIGGISGKWQPDDRERDAAWEMYVELVTRVAVFELRPGEGVIREAFNSLYSLFATTRAILRTHGPSVARSTGEDMVSFGSLAVAILNAAVRPLLARWHPVLLDHEARRPEGVSALIHEQAWEHNAAVREELARVRQTLTQYADLLAQVADVDRLVPPQRID